MQKNLDFGAVISVLRKGKKVSRAGRAGTYIWLLPKSIVERKWVKDPYLLEAFGEKETLECGYCIRMKDEDGSVSTWHPSISDVFAEDWHIID